MVNPKCQQDGHAARWQYCLCRHFGEILHSDFIVSPRGD